ncbi:nuclear transport factor 2 family protein [Chitinimonas sp. BJYL2]|uniref:nuclear transport factor 2 family protein n=1 Tax=Chitinimonas sp. BJYL2 TaxID=2976696 RepID=UPI0022B41C5C|nr:nuclear transport factor 2 family protein [Chitinimonas sp. BJYL2]
MTLSERCLHYLDRYAHKDLAALDSLFADDITLRDWKIAVQGKAAALDESRKNFAAAEQITITPLAMHEAGDTVAAELHIVVNGTEQLYVVDILRFNAAGQITAIRAYLGRGD